MLQQQFRGLSKPRLVNICHNSARGGGHLPIHDILDPRRCAVVSGTTVLAVLSLELEPLWIRFVCPANTRPTTHRGLVKHTRILFLLANDKILIRCLIDQDEEVILDDLFTGSAELCVFVMLHLIKLNTSQPPSALAGWQNQSFRLFLHVLTVSGISPLQPYRATETAVTVVSLS